MSLIEFLCSACRPTGSSGIRRYSMLTPPIRHRYNFWSEAERGRSCQIGTAEWIEKVLPELDAKIPDA